MKLNPDCIRDILLAVEDDTDFYHVMVYRKGNADNNKRFNLYSHEEIVYHIRQCELSNLILDVHYYSGATSIDIADVSPLGHKFIANVRENKIWYKVKAMAKEVGSSSLSALMQISSGIITNLIESRFDST